MIFIILAHSFFNLLGMGITKKITNKNCLLVIWKITEELKELEDLLLNNQKIDLSIYSNESRKKEILATRILMNNIYSNKKIKYNEYGAPYINKNEHISITHSNNLVAIGISKKKIGIDIQYIDKSITKLAHKFISQENLNNLSEEKATLIWSCKEAIYKWFQKGNINFKNTIKILPFDLKNQGKIKAIFKKNTFALNYLKLDNYFLVYVCK